MLLLDRARDGVHEECDGPAHVHAHVAAVGPEQQGDRLGGVVSIGEKTRLRIGKGPTHADVPCLRHARDPTAEVAAQKREDGGDARGQVLRLVPGSEDVAVAAAEELVFDEQDDGEGDGPVAEQGDEVVDDGLQALLAGDGEHGDDDGDEERPDEARDGVEVVAQQLERQPAGVVDRDVVPQHGEGEQDEAELGPADRVVNLEDEAAQGVLVVGVRVGRVLGEEDGDADGGADGDAEGGGDDDAEEGQGEDLPRGSLGGVVAVVVGGDGAPARCVRCDR